MHSEANGGDCMKTPVTTQRWIWTFRHQPLTIRLLAAAAGLLTAAAAFAAPAEADPNDDNFIDALNHAGVDFGQPGNAMSVGQSICPMLAQPGGNFAAAAASVSHRGMSPQMAQMFTTIAIQMYCPQEIANITSGNLAGALPGGIPGMPGGGMPGGMPGGIPGMPGGIPGMPGGGMPGGMPGGIPGMTGGVPGMPGMTGGLSQIPGVPGI
ncbi:hypothetical protein MHEI_10260 [Mycobacterium heidelbergense]|nr:hypothetical protein MHEI_10260 [Mycobacterium heidelbergense]